MEDQSKHTVASTHEVNEESPSLAEERIGDSMDAWRHLPYGYQWPASRLSRHQMEKLTIIANHLGRPVNQILKEAVDDFTDRIIADYELI